MIEQDFGLNVFTSLQPVTDDLGELLGREKWHYPQEWQKVDDYDDERTRYYHPLSYLTIPCLLTRQGVLLLNSHSRYGVEYHYGTSFKGPKLDLTMFSVIQPDMLQLTDDKKRLFGHVLNFFRLKPYVRLAEATSIQAHFNHKVGRRATSDQTAEMLPDRETFERLTKGMLLLIVNVLRAQLTPFPEMELEAWPKLMNLTAMQVDVPPLNLEPIEPNDVWY